MKTKGKEFVKIIDICDSCAQKIFQLQSISISAGTTQFKIFLSLQKKNYKVVYQSKVTQFIGYERELTREVHWF